VVVRTFAASFVLAGAFYLLLIDTTSSPELYAGAGATLLAALGATAARRAGVGGASAPTRSILRVGRALAQVPGDVLTLSAAAVVQLVSPRPVLGTLRAIPFRFGEAEDGQDIGRRALAEGLGSLSPNTIVIGVDLERDLLLAHQLRASGGRESLDVLGLG